jgi:hypothetical protein
MSGAPKHRFVLFPMSMRGTIRNTRCSIIVAPRPCKSHADFRLMRRRQGLTLKSEHLLLAWILQLQPSWLAESMYSVHGDA